MYYKEHLAANSLCIDGVFENQIVFVTSIAVIPSEKQAAESNHNSNEALVQNSLHNMAYLDDNALISLGRADHDGGWIDVPIRDLMKGHLMCPA